MRRNPVGIGVACALATALTIIACGGGGNPTSPTPPPGGGGGGGGSTMTITIGSDGRVSPKTLTVPVGSRVTFVNNHNRQHDMASDPHPSHEDCPELSTVGFLQPGQSRETQNLVTARTCGFHDHGEPLNDGLKGSIRIQ